MVSNEVADNGEFAGKHPLFEEVRAGRALSDGTVMQIGEWAEQAAGKQGGDVQDADIDLYSGVGDLAGLSDIAIVGLLLACPHAWQAICMNRMLVFHLLHSMAGCVLSRYSGVLLHCRNTYCVSKVPIDKVQGLQLAPFFVKTSGSRCWQLGSAVDRQFNDFQLAAILSCCGKHTDGLFWDCYAKLHALSTALNIVRASRQCRQ